MGTKRNKNPHVYPDLKPFFALLDTVTYTVKGTVSQERGKKEVAAFICYADSAEWWNKKH